MLVLESQQVRVQTDAVGEGQCPVDRVEDPPAPGPAGLLDLFFPEDPVAGVRQLELLADEPLGLPIGLGDRRAVALLLDGEAGRAEVTQRELARLTGQLNSLLQEVGEGIGCQLGQFLEFVRHGNPPASRP